MNVSISELREFLSAAKAKAPYLSDRLEKAACLVALHDIRATSNPAIFEVPSEHVDANGNRKFYSTGEECTCVDYKQGKAPKNLCKHRLAIILCKRLEESALRRAEIEANQTKELQQQRTSLEEKIKELQDKEAAKEAERAQRESEALHHLKEVFKRLG